MNKRILFVLALILVISAPSAFALNCKESQKLGGSDECWTQVKVSASETLPVTAGTILVYDFASAEDSDDAAMQVRVATASADGYKVAGVAQATIATGDYGLVQVRGKGVINVIRALSSGDRIYTTSSAGKGATSHPLAVAASRDKAIAFALEDATATSQIDAFLTIV